ncbi:glycosyltransferase [Candidatus Nitrotoga sp. AM1P]|uniref:glycosyltransferase n=1 Tax=Candidatus Nitrotoga sp. AM1P TaxID=2559597 RepID=UPI0010B03550|nr:glycosyltransferase [Candidatus Nitrotoga sp. AM1P]BBJ22922.1 mannosyltransferase A [Candidatus Nitrotoga sp. AM1P]
MRIVIDMQGAQGSNRQRGIGRYTLSITKAIIRNRGDHEVLLALNGLFPDTIEPIRAAFDGLLPQKNIRVWQAPGPRYDSSNENHWRTRAAELVREAFLASLKPDIILVNSLFEGSNDDAATSIGMLSRTMPTAVILHDLIPLIHRHLYLQNPLVESWYENKLGHLRRADLLLANSESSRQEGIRYLSFPPEACLNISAAADPQFQPQQIDSKRKSEIRQRYGLHRPYVMYTGGIDHRKNVEGLIRAYSKLTKPLRTSHQLAIVCANLTLSSRAALKKIAREQGLKDDEVVLTEFVPEDDLLMLYGLCKTFVLPSWHEGFGLPALEAMSCGCAVIGSNTSSLPEVIGRDDALFDPMDDMTIAEKLTQVLTDEKFRLELEQHGLEQAKLFSWDTTAQRAIAAFENLHTRQSSDASVLCPLPCRPKLAYVSPLPPVRSGISDYSAELLPELARHYDIDVIVAQDSVSVPWIEANCPIHSVEWFKTNANRYDRVLYHFGNNTFHQHMFNLLEEVPGVVTLHDFFLSGVVGHMHFSGQESVSWVQALYQNHGYAAMQQHFSTSDTAEVPWRYPCNLGVLQTALGVVVHSKNSIRLAGQWIDEKAADDWAVVPLLRIPEFGIDRTKARRLLGFGNDDFVVCSFGLLGMTKLNHRLLDAWLTSTLAKNIDCILVFVGENQGGVYGAELVTRIRQSGLSKRIRITGWTDTATFRHYLAAADAGVQLRTLSRGETSATVLDCMNYGLPTIVNINGSMADLPDDGVWKLSDEFDDADLVGALETLWRDPARRQQLGARAREIILTHHAPRTCADQYAQAIESIYQTALTNESALVRALSHIEPAPTEAPAWISVAEATVLSISPRHVPRQLLIDISELVQRDSKSGIQRAVRSILNELLANPPAGYRVEPVYATPDHSYRYARRFTLRFLNCPESILTDDPIEFRAGDLFLGLDLQPQVVPSQQAFYKQLRNYGIQVQFVVFDLLPIILPKAFPEWATKIHQDWLQVVTESDGAICISKAVADELTDWLKANGLARQRPFMIDWFHLGGNIEASSPSKGVPDNARLVLSQLANRPSFLMVGTLEPRKGYIQALAAFEKIWAENVDVNLVIVGKQGWMMESLVDRLRQHPELGKRLFWLDGISDEYLEKIYTASTCLIAASAGEGFGLPLIEAAQHKKPIIARDIPVFREVAGEHAFYFSGLAPLALARAISEWLTLNANGLAPQSIGMSWLTWQQSAEQLLTRVLTSRNQQVLQESAV